MANETLKEKGFLSNVWKAHMTAAKYIGLFGLPVMLGMLPKAAVTAVAADPAAGVMTTLTTLWGIMGSTIAEFALPGWSIIGGQIGDVVSGAFNVVANAAAITPIPAIAEPSP